MKKENLETEKENLETEKENLETETEIILNFVNFIEKSGAVTASGVLVKTTEFFKKLSLLVRKPEVEKTEGDEK